MREFIVLKHNHYIKKNDARHIYSRVCNTCIYFTNRMNSVSWDTAFPPFDAVIHLRIKKQL